MKKIDSFYVDHTRLQPGIYVSRIDKIGSETITTFDLRMKVPNSGNFLSQSAMHTMEHLGATFLRNDPVWHDLIIYFGPMGCRTGFYLIVNGKWGPFAVRNVVGNMLSYIIAYSGDILGATEVECGNYQEHSLEEAKKEAQKYLNIVSTLKDENSTYPQ